MSLEHEGQNASGSHPVIDDGEDFIPDTPSPVFHGRKPRILGACHQLSTSSQAPSSDENRQTTNEPKYKRRLRKWGLRGRILPCSTETNSGDSNSVQAERWNDCGDDVGTLSPESYCPSEVEEFIDKIISERGAESRLGEGQKRGGSLVRRKHKDEGTNQKSKRKRLTGDRDVQTSHAMADDGTSSLSSQQDRDVTAPTRHPRNGSPPSASHTMTNTAVESERISSPVNDSIVVRTLRERIHTRFNGRKCASFNRGRPDRDHSTPNQASSSLNNSPVFSPATRMIQQLAEDEMMARQLQEETDREYAFSLVQEDTPSESAASDGSGQIASSILGEGITSARSVLNHNNRMLTLIGQMSDYEWEVHQALAQGRDLPEPPANCTTSLSDVINTSVLEFINSDYNYSNAILQRNPATDEEAESRTTRSRSQLNSRNRTRRGVTLGNSHSTFYSRVMSPTSSNQNWRAMLSRGRSVHYHNDSLDSSNYEMYLELADTIGEVKRGLDAHQIDMLPLKTYSNNETNENGAKACNICMADYGNEDLLRSLPCFHSYHCDCIDKWLKRNATCPVCRAEVTLAE